MKTSSISIVFLLSGLLSYESVAQKKYTLSGTMKDSQTGEALIGATVYITSMRKGTTTNNYASIP